MKPSQHAPARIVMAVGNPGSNDNRVVRAAEAASRAGYDVHVVGFLAPGFAPQERLNSVTYHRVAIGAQVTGLALELCSDSLRRRLLRWWLSIHLSRGGLSRNSNSFEAKGLGSFELARPQDFFPMLATSFMYRFRRYVITPAINRARNQPVEREQHVARPQDHQPARTDRIRASLAPFASLWPRFQQGRYLLALYPKLVELKADAYHAHELSALEACALAAEFHRAKLVYDSHELEPFRNAPWTHYERRFWAEREARLIKAAQEVITVSYGVAKELMKLYSLERVTVIRNAYPMASKVAGSDLRSSLGLAPEVPLIVFVGLLTFNRGLDLVLEALARLPGYHLVMVGPANKSALAHVLQYSQRLGVQDRFHVHPKVPYQELVSFISTADLSVIPLKNSCRSYFYALPNKIFECVFAGLPVVASNFPDMALFIEENRAGAVFEPGDIDDLVQKIRYVYENRGALIPRERVAVLQRENCYEREAEKLLALYHRLGLRPPSPWP